MKRRFQLLELETNRSRRSRGREGRRVSRGAQMCAHEALFRLSEDRDDKTGHADP